MMRADVLGFPSQNDHEFPYQYNKTGCYAHCIAKIAWDERAYSIEPTMMINDVRKRAHNKAIIDDEYTVMYPDRLFCLYGLWTAFTDRYESADYVCEPSEREILRMYYDRPDVDNDNKYHFIQGDGQSGVRWDPWEGGSLTAAYGVVLDKRVFKMLGRAYGGC